MQYNEITLQVKRELNKLQRKFVITPVDKAANNYAFTCKKFYKEMINEHLQANNYELCQEEGAEILRRMDAEINSLLTINNSNTFQSTPIFILNS